MRLQRIVVVNDDGIGAPGLSVAEALADELAEEVWVFAPATNQSGMAQALSLNKPVEVRCRGLRRYSITGTPADCVMVALGSELMGGSVPDLVLSGVNWGYNISDAVMYSGTVGAALTSAHFGLPAIALSQAFRDVDSFDFSVSSAWGHSVIKSLWRERDTNGCLWNINFPAGNPNDVAGLRFTRQISGGMLAPLLEVGFDPEGQPCRQVAFKGGVEEINHPDSCARALREGYVSAMPLKCERCDEDRLADIGAGREWKLGRRAVPRHGGLR